MHDGPVPTESERQALEASVMDKMGKINAAIAILLNLYSGEKLSLVLMSYLFNYFSKKMLQIIFENENP